MGKQIRKKRDKKFWWMFTQWIKYLEEGTNVSDFFIAWVLGQKNYLRSIGTIPCLPFFIQISLPPLFFIFVEIRGEGYNIKLS